MIKVGVTGGIGSGKTIVCEIFKQLGIPVYHADDEAKKLYDKNDDLRTKITELLGEDIAKLNKEVEVDETYIGGVRKGKRGRGARNKSKVIGATQRQGKVVARVSPDVKKTSLVPFITKNVDRDATLYTDEFPSYDIMSRIGYKHIRINHNARVYAIGKTHTNTIEGFWSLVKRGIDGVYHSVSPQYLQSYLNEYSFRYNHRKAETSMFKIFLSRIS